MDSFVSVLRTPTGQNKELQGEVKATKNAEDFARNTANKLDATTFIGTLRSIIYNSKTAKELKRELGKLIKGEKAGRSDRDEQNLVAEYDWSSPDKQDRIRYMMEEDGYVVRDDIPIRDQFQAYMAQKNNKTDILPKTYKLLQKYPVRYEIAGTYKGAQ